MTRITALALGFVLVVGTAQAGTPVGAGNPDVDCGEGGSACTTTPYGLGDFPSFRKDEVPVDLVEPPEAQIPESSFPEAPATPAEVPSGFEEIPAPTGGESEPAER